MRSATPNEPGLGGIVLVGALSPAAGFLVAVGLTILGASTAVVYLGWFAASVSFVGAYAQRRLDAAADRLLAFMCWLAGCVFVVPIWLLLAGGG